MTGKTLTLGFLGFGLIGGSIAKALKEHNPQLHIMIWDPNENTCKQALSEKVAQEAFSRMDWEDPNIMQHLLSCDVLFLCGPVLCNGDNLLKIKKAVSPSCIITDVGSVKNPIHKTIREIGLEKQFIGGHPMAGSERFGYSNARASLLENAYYILAPEKEVAPEQVQLLTELIASTKAIPMVLTPNLHDHVTAAVSHLPHILASALVHLVKEQDSPDEIMKQIAAGGFKDITRIASSSPTMWQQICMENKDEIARFLELFISSLTDFKNLLNGDENSLLYDFFESARVYRDAFAFSDSGPLKKVWELTVDIPDRPGALADLVTLLASHNISIKNIGITHNREALEGSVRIEFQNEKALSQAKSILSKSLSLPFM